MVWLTLGSHMAHPTPGHISRIATTKEKRLSIVVLKIEFDFDQPRAKGVHVVLESSGEMLG